MKQLEEELTFISVSEGTAGDGVQMDATSIVAKLMNIMSPSSVMPSLFSLRSTDNLVLLAKNAGSAYLETVIKDIGSEFMKSMVSVLSHQESLRNNTAARAESAKGILQSNLNSVSPKVALAVGEAKNLRDEQLKTAQQKHDDECAAAKARFDQEINQAGLTLQSSQSKINSTFDDFKAHAEMQEQVFKQELEESKAKASSEVDRTAKSNADLIKPKAMIKTIQLGHEMLSYYCEGNVDATAKADVIYHQLTEHMQPALEANDQDAMLREIVNWRAHDMDL